MVTIIMGITGSGGQVNDSGFSSGIRFPAAPSEYADASGYGSGSRYPGAGAPRSWQEQFGQVPARHQRQPRPRRPPGRRGGRFAAPVVLAVVAGLLAFLVSGRARDVLPGAGAGPPPAPPAASAAFPGYPGQSGPESVSSVASAGDVQIAVGQADGRAAVWHRAGDGPWTLLTSAAVLAQPPGAFLTSVARGAAGWLAVGDVTGGGPATASLSAAGRQPVILTSPDGVTWQSAAGAAAFAGPGFTVNAAAASARGYVVVGEQVLHGTPSGAMWWSPDLASWTRGVDTVAATVSSPASGMSDSKIFAVTATPEGFAAVGTHNGCHTAWVTADGLNWKSYDIPQPAGTTDPLLNRVAVHGSTVVAAGDLGDGGGRIPLVVVSADGGATWKATAIGGTGSLAGPQGTVTALASDGSGFTAAGLSGPPGAQRAVTWTSPDGTAWSQPAPAPAGTQLVTVLAPSGGTAAGIAAVSTAHGTSTVEAQLKAPGAR